MSKKTKSSQAQVAAQIKKYLAEKGIKCRARSESFSMGDSVGVTVYDQPPKIMKMIESETNKYQYGHFNGMEDIYEYSNNRDDIPQTKYLHIDNNYSDELMQAVWEFARKRFSGADEYPETHKEVSTNARVFDEWLSTVLYRVLNGYYDDHSAEFWAEYLPETQTPTTSAPSQAGNFSIEEHTHTKKGFQMFICIMSERVSREEYLNLLDRAKALSGWYSRKWGTTPAGFAFKDRSKAEEFAGSSNPTTPPEGETPPTKPIKKADLSGKLRTLADKMGSQIENKFSDRLTNTPKRVAQANYARLEGERLQRTQQALKGLADLHEAGTVPPVLSGFTSKKAIYDLMGTITEPVQNGYHTYSSCTGKPRHETPGATALWRLITGKTKEEERAEDLKRRENELQFSKIPNYFPTPSHIVGKMLDFADIQAGETVLEPSGGKGDIISAIIDSVDTEIVSYETNYSLFTLLLDKFPSCRLHVEQKDFLDVGRVNGGFPKIVMNPPFERGDDIKHIKHALNLLAPGGRLVALCAGGPKQTAELQPLADHWEELPAGSFKESGTGVNVSLMVINK